jgi:hypothetical protein
VEAFTSAFYDFFADYILVVMFANNRVVEMTHGSDLRRMRRRLRVLCRAYDKRVVEIQNVWKEQEWSQCTVGVMNNLMFDIVAAFLVLHISRPRGSLIFIPCGNDHVYQISTLLRVVGHYETVFEKQTNDEDVQCIKL